MIKKKALVGIIGLVVIVGVIVYIYKDKLVGTFRVANNNGDSEKPVKDARLTKKPASESKLEELSKELADRNADKNETIIELTKATIGMDAFTIKSTRSIDDLSVLSDKELYGKAKIGDDIVIGVEAIVLYDPVAKKILNWRMTK